MSTLQLPGLFSGIDTTTLIAQLMAIEKRTLNIYQQRVSDWDKKKDALSDLESKLTALKSTVSALSDADAIRAFNVTSSDSDIITAEATNEAFEGHHTIIVNRLATADGWIHTDGLEYAEDYVREGTFIYSYNGKETVITTTDTTTLEDLAGLINNDANNPGVTASILHYDNAYHLVLNGNDAGSDYQISVNSSSTEVWQADAALTVNSGNATLNTLLTQLDQFGDNPLEGGETITISGTDRDKVAITPVTFEITSNTKISHIIDKIKQAFGDNVVVILENGKIVVTDKTSGASDLSVMLTYNPNDSAATLDLPDMAVLAGGGATTASLDGFTPSDFERTQTAQDSQIKVDGFPAGVDEWISRSSNTIDDVIYGVTLHLHDITDATGEEITLTRDIQSVKEKLKAMVNAYNVTAIYLKEKTGYNDVLKTAGILMGDYVVSSIRNQLITPLVAKTTGFVTDLDSFLMPGQIGLQLDRDGMLTLDDNAFDKAVGEDYMGVLAIIGANKTGSSDSNTIRFYGSSETYTSAGTYNVKVTVSGGAITSAKIKLSTDSTWRDATFSGNVVTGNSSFDSNGDPVYSENGLQFSVDLGKNGTFTSTVRVKQGFTGAIDDALDKMLKASTGSIDIDQEHINDTIEHLQDRIVDEQYRVTQKERRLIEKFARLERTLALLQSQLAALGLNTTSSS